MGVVTDNSPLLRIRADYFLNNRLQGNKFGKRVRISENDSPEQDYMKRNLDLAYLPEKVDYVPVDSNKSLVESLA